MAVSPLKKLYLRILLKFFRVTGFKKYFPIQDGSLKGSLFNVNVDNNIFYGSYESAAVEKTKALVKGRGDLVFYDIGAHYGFFSLAFSEFAPKAVFAFEAYLPNYQVLQKTLQLNNNVLVQANNFAIANNGQPVVMFTNSGLSESNTFINSAQLPAATEKKAVAAKSIDELVEKENYAPPAFIKIDVEGAEYEVLRGALSTINKYRPYILLATHDCHLPGVQESCITLLNSCGYTTEKLDDKKALDGMADFLCVPAQ